MPPELREALLERPHLSHELVEVETAGTLCHPAGSRAPDQARRRNAARSAAPCRIVSITHPHANRSPLRRYGVRSVRGRTAPRRIATSMSEVRAAIRPYGSTIAE